MKNKLYVFFIVIIFITVLISCKNKDGKLYFNYELSLLLKYYSKESLYSIFDFKKKTQNPIIINKQNDFFGAKNLKIFNNNNLVSGTITKRLLIYSINEKRTEKVYNFDINCNIKDYQILNNQIFINTEKNILKYNDDDYNNNEIIYTSKNYINSFFYYNKLNILVVNEIENVLNPKNTQNIIIINDLNNKTLQKLINVQKPSYSNCLNMFLFVDLQDNKLKMFNLLSNEVYDTNVHYKKKYLHLANYVLIDKNTIVFQQYSNTFRNNLNIYKDYDVDLILMNFITNTSGKLLKARIRYSDELFKVF